MNMLRSTSYLNLPFRCTNDSIITNDNPRGRSPLISREPLDTEDSEGALYHDAGPSIESPTHQTGPLQHLSLQRDTPQKRPQGQAPGTAQHHRPPQPPPGQDGVGEGGCEDTNDQHDIVCPSHSGVAPAKTHFDTLSYWTPGVEYTGLETRKHRVDS